MREFYVFPRAVASVRSLKRTGLRRAPAGWRKLSGSTDETQTGVAIRCRRSRSSTTGEPLNEHGRQHTRAGGSSTGLRGRNRESPVSCMTSDLRRAARSSIRPRPGKLRKPNVTDEWIKVPGGPRGDVDVRIVRPAGPTGIHDFMMLNALADTNAAKAATAEASAFL